MQSRDCQQAHGPDGLLRTRVDDGYTHTRGDCREKKYKHGQDDEQCRRVGQNVARPFDETEKAVYESILDLGFGSCFSFD